MTSIGKILDLYKQTDGSELEIRYTISDHHLIKNIINKINGPKTLEQTVNIINPIETNTRLNSSNIITIYFVDGIQIKESTIYINKKSLAKIKQSDGDIPYSISLAKESIIPKHSGSKFGRIKLRLSIRPSEYPHWRVDITFVKTVNDINRELKEAKSKMLYNIGIEEINEKAPWKYSSSIEVEIEHVGDKKILTEDSVNDIMNYMSSYLRSDNNNYQDAIYQIAKNIIDPPYLNDFKNKKGMRDMSNKVLELDRGTYFKQVLPNIVNFYVLDKADGVRTILRIHGKNIYAVNNVLSIIPLDNKVNYDRETICDTELIEEDGNKLYYIFDVIMYDGKNVTKLPTSQRISYIENIIKMGNGYIVSKFIIPLTSNYTREITNAWKRAQNNTKYHVDGLIFTPKNEQYRTMKSWKWKPIESMSIDFLVKLPVDSKDNNLLFLFSGIDKKRYDDYKLIPLDGYNSIFPGQKMFKYFPIQFSPSNDPYAYHYHHPVDSEFKLNDIINKVCEFRRVNVEGVQKWDLMRIRTDRTVDVERGNYFGNSFYVAEYTWQNYQNPLTFDDLLLEQSNMGYFQEEKDKIYSTCIYFNSYVKGRLISEYKNSLWLADIASGHGQDMGRISNANIKNAIFIDSDAQAMSDLITRKHNPIHGKGLNTRIFTKLASLKDDYKEIIESIKNMGIPVGDIDVVMCNFAIHYFMGTPSNVRNVIYFIKSMLKTGGDFFMTAFNGERIFNLLKNGSWLAREGEVIKYSINKDYTSDTLESTGQQINLILPFSAGKHYSEYLVNFKYLIEEFEKNGFETKKTGSITDYLDIFLAETKINKQLTEDDLKFIGLYSYVVFTKKNDEKITNSAVEKKERKKREKKVDGGEKKERKKREKKVDGCEKKECKNASYNADLIKCIHQIANNYVDLNIFTNLFLNAIKIRIDPVVVLNDIKYILPYQEKSKLLKFGWHNGQRKLFLTELQFLTHVDKKTKYCIYAGSSPGNKTHYLSTLFPHIKFILVDPNEFSLILPDKRSHRLVAHDDIVHLKNGYPKSNFKANSIDVKEDYYTNIINTNYKIYIIEDYMTSTISHNLAQLGNDVVFISDIRSNIYEGSDSFPADFDVCWNNAMNYNWIYILRPSLSMLKYRQPYFNIITAPIDAKYVNDVFEEAKRNGIDFLQNYKDQKEILPISDIYVQAWAPISSTEVRLWITRDNINTAIPYDAKLIESKMFYYNNIERTYVYHHNPNADPKIHFCNCNDCALENKIWTDYGYNKQQVHKAVLHLGEITFRPLSKKHIYDYYNNISLNDSCKRIQMYMKLLPENMKLNNKKKAIHKGDKGAIN